ncbi:MAG: HEAT repeat domain-containing protein, partial [Candidatus Auribacterota bacterium]|nr:HEAT repeat domain-containing protein [Candidatus Auribacterota bacterium]
MNVVKIVLVVLAFFIAVPSYADAKRRTQKTTVRIEKDAKVEKSEPMGNKGDFSKKTAEAVKKGDQETEVITLFKMINSNWSRSRRVAHKKLRELGADGTAVYIKILLDGKRVNREYAAKMLGEYPSKEGVAALRQALLNDNVARVRITCAESLAVIADKSALDDLITALGDKNRKVREKAIYAIGKMGDENVVPALIKILKDDNPETRQMVVFSLGELRDERATQALIETTLDPDAGVRAASAVALAKIGSRSVVDEIIGMLGDKSSDVRLSAVMALNILDNEKSVQPLIAMLSDKNGDVREVTFETLKKMDRQALLKALIQAMGSTNVNARIDASGWLTEVGA